MKTTVFEAVELSGIKFRNRIIRSATHEGLADKNGFPSEKLKMKYIQLAQGGVGAIITGYAGIQQNGKSAHFNMLMIDKDEHIEAYKKIVDAVHQYDTPIILQIAHCGRLTRSKITGEKPVAPSPIKDQIFNEEIPKELSEYEINKIIDNFVKAIQKGKNAGFDGVQLHLAHGYLLAQFLSSYTNRRKDIWGGSIENKYRIIEEIFKRARQSVGDYPIFVKMNGHDGRPGGMRVGEAVEIAKMLEISGCSGIEVSCGDSEDGFYSVRGKAIPVKAILKTHFKFNHLKPIIKKIIVPFIHLFIPNPRPIINYNVSAAEAIKREVSIPVIVVGGINSIDSILDIIENRKADLVSMSRPFILEPNLVNKFANGLQKKAKCIQCNYCTVAQFSKPLQCYYGKMK